MDLYAQMTNLPRGHSVVQIAVGKDADLLLLNSDTLELQFVYAKGKLVRTPEWTQGGMFERGKHVKPLDPVV